MAGEGPRPKLDAANVPDLGAINRKVKASTGLSAMVRHLDPDGTYEAKRADTPAGTVAVPNRSDVVSAEDLVEMMRVMVREELARAAAGE